MVVLILFPAGRSGAELRKLAEAMPEHTFHEANKFQVDVTSARSVNSIIKKHRPNVIVNTSDFEPLELICSKKGIDLCNVTHNSPVRQIKKILRGA